MYILLFNTSWICVAFFCHGCVLKFNKLRLLSTSSISTLFLWCFPYFFFKYMCSWSCCSCLRWTSASSLSSLSFSSLSSFSALLFFILYFLSLSVSLTCCSSASSVYWSCTCNSTWSETMFDTATFLGLNVFFPMVVKVALACWGCSKEW